jgi:transposase
MTTPGVGPVVSLTYRATVDIPARFRKSKSVGAVFGLTCAKYQSGEVDWDGRISRCGDEMMRNLTPTGRLEKRPNSATRIMSDLSPNIPA